MTQLDLVSKEVPYQHCLKKSEGEGEGKVLIQISITIIIKLSPALTLVKAMAKEVTFRKKSPNLRFSSVLVFKSSLDLRSTSTTPLSPPRRRSVQCNIRCHLRRGEDSQMKELEILLTKLRGVICRFWSHLGCSESHNY